MTHGIVTSFLNDFPNQLIIGLILIRLAVVLLQTPRVLGVKGWNANNP
jgi:hypothetical protein